MHRLSGHPEGVFFETGSSICQVCCLHPCYSLELPVEIRARLGLGHGWKPCFANVRPWVEARDETMNTFTFAPIRNKSSSLLTIAWVVLHRPWVLHQEGVPLLGGSDLKYKLVCGSSQSDSVPHP
jgi:hypothetical protein